MTLPVAILAGGLATRLRPVTETIPKALVEVAGEPFAFHQLRLLHDQGVRKAVFCVGYRGDQLAATVGDGSAFGMSVEYVYDGPQLLGTAGAVRNALRHLGDRFFVLYGDAYLMCDYGRIEQAFRDSGKPALMTVFRNEGRWDTSNVEYDGARLIAYSKTRLTPRMQHIDFGLGAFDRRLFELIPEGTVADLGGFYEDLARDGNLAAFEVAERFFEVGSFDGISALELHLKARRGDP